MKRMKVSELRTHLSQALEQVKNGEEILISKGKNSENMAVLIPYSNYAPNNKIKLGLLKDRGTVKFKDNFKMTTEDLIGE
ncbi:MAG: type II toxin-antitoxin system prevent-host-death family antitoxin [Candidatus Omnitrophica bacterium]|nr:type II toxin-antitoxin system prevent-host-death family antitoxin [Candidatus Omnitrophota bacterium]MCB9783389.1 type II toxin-antitoxin system prevent-host-death family antitoxin [Candidatus Omnitrophota bacterium]